MNKLSNRLDDILSGKGGEKDPIVIEGVITFGELAWSNHKASVTINKTTSDSLSIEYQVLNKDNQVVSDYQTIANGGTVSNLNLGDFVVARLTDGSNYGNAASIEATDIGKPIVTADTGTVTTNSIQVTNVAAVDNEAGMPAVINYSYYIKPSNGSYPSEASYTETETSCNFTGLTHKTSYDIKITATDIAGNTGVKEIKRITTGTVPDGSEGDIQTGVITFGTLTWSNQKASVKINKTTSDSLSIEYQVLNKDNQVVSGYQTIANGGTVSNLSLGDFVIARLTDGTNHGNTASIEITDGNAPTAPTFGTPTGEKKLSTSEWYTGDVTVPITPGTDNESGVLKTTYSITGAGSKAETEGTSVTISAEGTSIITAYTYDNAGHKTVSATTRTIKIDKTEPPTVTLTVSSYTGNKVTVGTSMNNTSDTSGIAKYIFEYKKSAESTWTTAVEQTTRPSNYTYTGLETNTSYNFRVVTVDNAGNKATATSVSQTTESVNDPMNPDIDTTYGGKTVTYSPKSGQTYSVPTTYSGHSSAQIFSTSDLAAGWQVWGTDDSYIYIISTNTTTKNLYLAGALGYNNGVTLLDNICNTVFTNKTTYPGSAAQNLKVEQVLAIKATSIANSNGNYGKTPYAYTSTYPYIWDTYEKSANNSVNNRSKAYALTTNTTAASQSYAPYSTYFYNKSMNTESAWVNSNYYSMIMTPTQTNFYWLSSRSVYPNGSNECVFGLQQISSSAIGGSRLYYYDFDYGKWSGMDINFALRPVVSFPTSMYSLDTSTTPAKIVKK